MLKEFKEFALQGNVMDLAVGVIIGAAFKSIIDALVDNIIMPLISIFTGGLNFDKWILNLPNGAKMSYGTFISAVINFIIIALVIFLIVKAMNKLRRTKEEDPTTKVCPHCKSEIDITATKCPNCTSDL